MKRTSKLHLLPLYCVCCLSFTLYSIHALAQHKDVAVAYKVDSTLYAYYLYCQAEILSPHIMQMADTLFRMAGEKGDTRMQAVALTNKLDHFYYQKVPNEDSLLHYLNIVKKFSKENNQPKYYYFAWAKRLIMYYIKNGQNNKALYQANRMLKEAEAEGYPTGIANAYNTLSTIYYYKRLNDLAIEYKEKEIEIELKYETNTFNLSGLYCTLATLYCSSEQYNQVEVCLEKAKKHMLTTHHEFDIHLGYSKYYRETKNFPKAKEYLDKTKELLDSQKKLSKLAYNYHVQERMYYMAIKQYDKALAIQKEIMKEYPSKNTKLETLRILATLYQRMENFPKAVEYYNQYIATNDSLQKMNEGIVAGEFAAILGVEQLNNEKADLQKEVQQRDLANKTRIIFFLVILLTLCIIIFYREYLLNGKLRRSEKQLSIKNDELQASEKELLIAKNKAEEASIMKTEFIQNMSHEIRTPLNSIVGFSQVISSISAKDEETKEYAKIIETGSNNLLRLIEDVLDLAALDSGTEISVAIDTNITAVCKECITQVNACCQPGVTLKLQAEQQDFNSQTNGYRLFQILLQLLRNATKFTHEGSILLEWHLDNEQKNVIFSVSDTGIGIPADKKEFIFERFSKIDSFAQGTGLGLSISRICAEKMGGSLVLDTNYTNGSRFVLTLPFMK